MLQIAAPAEDHGHETLENVGGSRYGVSRERELGHDVRSCRHRRPSTPTADPDLTGPSTDRSVPSAVTISHRSETVDRQPPDGRAASPKPTPSVTPAIPTDGHEPAGDRDTGLRQTGVQVNQLNARADSRRRRRGASSVIVLSLRGRARTPCAGRGVPGVAMSAGARPDADSPCRAEADRGRGRRRRRPGGRPRRAAA